jgi:ketosteroid isomerase-like protein
MRFTAVMAFALALCGAGVARADDDSDGVPVGRMVMDSDGLTCPKPDKDATPSAVIAGRVAALQAGNIDLVICTYAVDSTVLMAGSVITGRPNIKSAFVSFFGLLGNTVPTFTSQTFSGPIALITYTSSAPSVTVPDGADTFVISKGRIHYHTVSATLQFH